MTDWVLIVFSAALVNNIVVMGIIGTDPALAFTRRLDVAAGLSLVMIVLLPLATLYAGVIDYWLLTPLHLEHFRLLLFVAGIIILSFLLKLVIPRLHPKLAVHTGILLPFAAINTTVLGAMLLNREAVHGLLDSLAFGFGSALGFALVLLMLTTALERLEVADVPAPFRGLPIVLITLALISMAFMGFSGLIT